MTTERVDIPWSFIVYMVTAIAWTAIVMAVCTYLVFWMDQSGWWYVLALIIASFRPKYGDYVGTDEEDD